MHILQRHFYARMPAAFSLFPGKIKTEKHQQQQLENVVYDSTGINQTRFLSYYIHFFCPGRYGSGQLKENTNKRDFSLENKSRPFVWNLCEKKVSRRKQDLQRAGGYTECFICYRIYILKITQPFKYRCTQLQCRFAVTSEAPSRTRT